MTILCAWISIIAGVYYIIGSFVQNTKNFVSALLYKVIPFFLGTGCIFVGFVLLDIIKINLR